MPLTVVTKEGERVSLHSPQEFERVFCVHYLSALHHQDLKTQEVLKKRYERAHRKGWITEKQKWLGHYYAQGLKQGPLLDLTIRWLDPLVGYGVFTNRAIAAHVYIGEYTGLLRKRSFFKRWENLYCFDYTIGERRSTSYVIDAKQFGNHTRFINHSFTPNLTLVSVDHGGGVHVILFATRQIEAGEQLLYDYGEDYWQKRPPPVEL